MDPATQPSLLRYTLAFTAVGLAWGFTTPFMRRAALSANPDFNNSQSKTPRTTTQSETSPWIKRQVLAIWASVADLLARPGYLVPLLLNLSGSVWFFLLVGQAGRSLVVNGFVQR